MKKFGFVVLLLALVLSGCQAQDSSEPVLPSQSETSNSALPSEPAVDPSSPAVPSASSPYLEELVQGIVSELVTPEMSEYEKTKAAYDYLIDHTIWGDPIGLQLWQIYGSEEVDNPFVQQRAMSCLRFGVGMCEDYAAALTLLLQGMGLEARYVPGLTYSAEGNLVDHAWTAVQIDGVWYQLDSQLEDNISRNGTVQYRYFLRSENTLVSSHRWGQNLIDSGLLTPEQNAEIAEQYLTPNCPQNYPTPARRTLPEPFNPDIAALEAEVETELANWVAAHGPLPEIDYNMAPPVFGLAGFGPADEG